MYLSKTSPTGPYGCGRPCPLLGRGQWTSTYWGIRYFLLQGPWCGHCSFRRNFYSSLRCAGNQSSNLGREPSGGLWGSEPSPSDNPISSPSSEECPTGPIPIRQSYSKWFSGSCKPTSGSGWGRSQSLSFLLGIFFFFQVIIWCVKATRYRRQFWKKVGSKRAFHLPPASPLDEYWWRS